MSGTQHLRLFLQERLTLAAEEIFGVVEKSISEYEEQVVQSKREVEQLKQHILTLTRAGRNSQPVSEELLPLQQLNPRQELMSSQEDEDVQHQFPQVKEEQVDLSIIPHSETSIYNIVTNGFVTSESTSDSQLIPPYTTVTVQHSTQVKEEQVDLSIIPDSETGIYNSGTNGFVTSESASDSQLIRTYDSDDIFCIEQKICRFCRQRFPSYAELMKHVEESHIGHKAFKCPECDKEFARKNLWADHYRIHTGVKPHSCPACGKSFTQVANLKAHMKIHTGVKNHSCPICGRLFSRSTTLKDHMRVHTGIKPHCCPDCGRLFADRSNLTVHMKIHTGDKPYSCTVCGKSFIQRSCLKSHMNVHTGKKPYLCNKCGETVTNIDHHKGCQM